MTVYVLGAGASYHAGYPLASALGQTLYQWVVNNVSESDFWRGCIEELYESYGGLTDFESILTELDECPLGSRAAQVGHRGNIRAAVRIYLPAFFNTLRERPAPLYDLLATTRLQPGDVILTFNYDLSCERASRQAGLWEIGDGYGFPLGIEEIPSSKVKILKLHGSTNWWGPIFGGMRGFFQAGPTSLPTRPVILSSKDFEFLGYGCLGDPSCAGMSRPAAVPALITPTRRKRFYEETSLGREWEEFWAGLWSQADHAVSLATDVVLIGYSMPAADEAARRLLLNQTNPNANITVCCGSDSDKIRAEFTSRGFRSLERPKTTFETFLEK
jgi:hypothetical protein